MTTPSAPSAPSERPARPGRSVPSARSTPAARTALPTSPQCERPLAWGDAVLGGRDPLVAVAVTGPALDDLARQASAARRAGADVVELRLDMLDGVLEATSTRARVRAALDGVRAACAPEALAAEGGAPEPGAPETGAPEAGVAETDRTAVSLPLILTLRTEAEGGRAPLDAEAYGETLGGILDGLAQERASAGPGSSPGAEGCGAGRKGVVALDVELASGLIPDLAPRARGLGLAVIGSSHDFSATPPVSQILARLRAMEDLGADAAKVAVTPGTSADVVRLLAATAQARAAMTIPVITMSMGPVGELSRHLGGLFGSALTFATAGGEASAPGQPPVDELRAGLRLARAYAPARP